jgi:undecaprenyl-phosphate 4-deoxy-4-formamido-L-arabinose transferase
MTSESTSSANGIDLTVVVPVYNSASTLAPLAERIANMLQSHSLVGELIFVNDGSRDGSWKAAAELASAQPWITAINLSRNCGQHVALLTGMRLARGRWVVTMDDDLQHPPEEIPILLAKLNDGADVVYGVPENDRHDFWRNALSVTAKVILQRFIGIKRAEDTSAFRAIRSEILAPFRTYDSFYVDVDALLTWVTDRFDSVRVRHFERTEGESNYTLGSLIRHALKMVLCFTTLPLRIASIVGFAFTLFGLLALGYVLVVYAIYGSSVPGFAFLACLISIFSGAQLFSLGILGEYFAKVHFRIMGRPGSLVRESVNARTLHP